MTGTIVFRSKRAFWFTIATLLPLAFAFAMLFSDKWYMSLLMGPVMLYVLPIYFRTSYKIHDINQLTVVCGLLYMKTFKISDLQHIRPTNNIISSPALSLDRLELKFKNKEILLISPVKPEQFIEVLLAINPEIEVKKK